MAISVLDLFKIGGGAAARPASPARPARGRVPRARPDKYKETSRGGLSLDVLEASAEVSVNLPKC